MQYSTMQCNAIQCNAMQCNTIQCNTIHCSIIQNNAIDMGSFKETGRHVPMSAEGAPPTLTCVHAPRRRPLHPLLVIRRVLFVFVISTSLSLGASTVVVFQVWDRSIDRSIDRSRSMSSSRSHRTDRSIDRSIKRPIDSACPPPARGGGGGATASDQPTRGFDRLAPQGQPTNNTRAAYSSSSGVHETAAPPRNRSHPRNHSRSVGSRGSARGRTPRPLG